MMIKFLSLLYASMIALVIVVFPEVVFLLTEVRPELSADWVWPLAVVSFIITWAGLWEMIGRRSERNFPQSREE